MILGMTREQDHRTNLIVLNLLITCPGRPMMITPPTMIEGDTPVTESPLTGTHQGHHYQN